MDTPAFLLWALEYSCTIRGFEDGTNPERVERQLRAARATSDAVREGRVLNGLCIDPPSGFRIDAALELYGGLDSVQAACGGCPANALQRLDSRSLAGCFGLVPLPSEIAHSVEAAWLNDEFPPTNPPWYGLWMKSPIEQALAKQIHTVLARIARDPSTEQPFVELQLALEIVIEHGRPLHLIHFPPGRVDGRAWRLIVHCPRCKAPWIEPNSRVCAVCNHQGAPPPDRKRQARGRRPYFPLDRLLGTAAAEELLTKFAVYRTQQPCPDRPQSPHPPRPPDSPPAG